MRPGSASSLFQASQRPSMTASKPAKSRSENAPGMKRVLGGQLRSPGPEAQRVEAAIAARALNRMAEIGMPRAQRVA